MTTDDKSASGAAVNGYVDLYLLPVPADNDDRYRVQATRFGAIAKEYGALSYREFLGDDLGERFTAIANGQALTAVVVDFESRAHRDEVMGKVMEDPRVKGMVEAEDLTDMNLMSYGGFETFVDP